MGKKFPSVNLVKTDQNVLFEKFINWALTIGRAVVILTELIALSAFIYRFSLDRELIDLHSKIKQEQAIVSYWKSSEDKYRNLQNRLTVASQITASANRKLKIFNDVLVLVPSGMSFTDLNFSGDRIRISADVESIISLSNFIESLKKYPSVETISVDKIENKPSSGVIKVAISVSFKEK